MLDMSLHRTRADEPECAGFLEDVDQGLLDLGVERRRLATHEPGTITTRRRGSSPSDNVDTPSRVPTTS